MSNNNKMKAEEEDDEIEVESRPSRSFSKPSWLLFTIAELDERMKMVTSNIHDEEDKVAADTFGERAESYYRKRPQLLSLLRQLYNGYLSLADRYCQTLAKHHHRHRHSPPQTPPPQPPRSSSNTATFDLDSDAESSLSYQMTAVPTPKLLDADTIVAELVMKTVEYDIIIDELSTEERRWGESSRKIELQKSLLEVLESERLILLNENARLAYTAAELAEENKGLSAESAFMKMKACELARCVLKTREDYRVCMLSRKIEDLQGQIYGLEKRNKEYYEQLVKLEGEKKSTSKSKKKKKRLYSWSWSKGEVTLEDCFQGDEETVDGSVSTNSTTNISTSTNSTNSTATTVAEVMMKRGGGSSNGGGRRVLKMWDRVKNFDMFNCGPHFHPTC